MPTFLVEPPEFEFEFEVYCGRCGSGMCHLADADYQHRRDPRITIEPCEKCLEASKEEGYDKGYKDGLAQAEGI